MDCNVSNGGLREIDQRAGRLRRRENQRQGEDRRERRMLAYIPHAVPLLITWCCAPS